MRRFFAVASLAAAVGCADLSPIQVGVCGNRVVEPTAQEDCDGSAPKGARCAAPDEPHACLYVCDADAVCPAGYGCGLDGVCRVPSATWSRVSLAPLRGTESPVDIAVADADGDGRGDVWEMDRRSTVVHFGEGAELHVGGDELVPALGVVEDISADGLADAIVPAGLGYFVLLGDAQRAERATAYGALPIPDGVTQVHALSAEVLASNPGREVIVLAMLTSPGGKSAPVMSYVSSAGGIEVVTELPDDPDHLSGPVKTARFHEASAGTPAAVPCEDIVLPFAKRDRLELFVPCAVGPGGTVGLNIGAKTTPVLLPQGATIAGPVGIEDANGDGHLDLTVVATRNGAYELDVAYGGGDGSFDSHATRPAGAVADGSARTAVIVGEEPPLAVRDLDGDGLLDWADATGVYVATGEDARTAPPRIAAHNSRVRWTSAIVDRLDGDALPDVVAASANQKNISVFLNSGDGALTAFTVPTRGNVPRLTTGDFDGDRVRDIAAAVATSATDVVPARETLAIAFGSVAGPPRTLKDIGEFRHILEISTSRNELGNPPVVDGADDIGALAEDEDGALAYATVFGQGDRELRAPYALIRPDLAQSVVEGFAPVRFAVADVDGDGEPNVVTLGGRIDKPETRIWVNSPIRKPTSELGRTSISDLIDVNAFTWDHVLMGAADLDGEPGEELVLLGPRPSGGSGMAIAHLGQAEDGLGYRLGEVVNVDYDVTRDEWRAPRADVYDGRLRTADLDGNGSKDVLVLVDANGRRVLRVWFNDREDHLPGLRNVDAPEDLDVRDFAVVQADDDARPEIAALTERGVFVADVDDDRMVTFRATPALTFSDSGATVLAAGDVDGDGLPDLAIVRPDGIAVHLGVPRNPRAATRER